METRRLGSSDLEISVVALGTWAMGGFMWGGTDEREAIAAIQRALDLGVTAIDTAPVYGLGLSERIVGRAIAGRRDQVAVLTKFGLSWGDPGGRESWASRGPDGRPVRIYNDARRATVIAECEASLRRLGVERIDLYQLHWPDPQTPLEETLAALERLVAAGKVRAVGVSNFPVELLAEARRRIPLASDQPPYSMLRRGIEQDVGPYCRQHGIGLLAYSPLERGLLTGKVSPDRVFPETDHRSSLRLYSPENRRRVNAFLERIRPIAARHEATLAQLVIHWTVRRPGITAALVGARNAAQAAENAGAAALDLDAGELSAIDAELDALALDL
jgi:aryl-alcohol dehydrogenase-like predicted oxidoreductase